MREQTKKIINNDKKRRKEKEKKLFDVAEPPSVTPSGYAQKSINFRSPAPRHGPLLRRWLPIRSRVAMSLPWGSQTR